MKTEAVVQFHPMTVACRPEAVRNPEFVNDFETPGCINLVCNRLIFY